MPECQPPDSKKVAADAFERAKGLAEVLGVNLALAAQVAALQDMHITILTRHLGADRKELTDGPAH